MSLYGSGLAMRIWYGGQVQMAQWHYDNLAAPYWRWYWNDKAGWTVHLGDKSLALGPDTVVLIPPETPFATSSASNPTHHYIEFTVDGTFQAIEPQFFSMSIPELGKARLARICKLIETSSLANEFQLQQDLFHCLSLIPQAFKDVDTIHSPINKVMQFLNTHLDQRFESEFLAELAGLSHDSFPRLFRKQVGEGLQAWHQRQRIRAVCFELHHSDKSIEHIADAYGFSDRYHLSKLFKKYRGIGPAEFRKRRYEQHQL